MYKAQCTSNQSVAVVFLRCATCSEKIIILLMYNLYVIYMSIYISFICECTHRCSVTVEQKRHATQTSHWCFLCDGYDKFLKYK